MTQNFGEVEQTQSMFERSEEQRLRLVGIKYFLEPADVQRE